MTTAVAAVVTFLKTLSWQTIVVKNGYLGAIIYAG
jgi:hypothetical protein